MPATFVEALPYLLAAAVLLLIGLWFLMRGSRRTNVTGRTTGDVLDEGAERAARNQALIDAPRSVEINIGETSAAANADRIAAAGAIADAEAGASVPPSRPVPDPVPASVSPPPPAPADAPASSTVPAAAAAASGGDDLSRIKGVGPKLVTLLAEQGITSFAQIAAWSEPDIASIDAKLGRFAGRITRDQWVEQAKLLLAGEDAAFAEKFGQIR